MGVAARRVGMRAPCADGYVNYLSRFFAWFIWARRRLLFSRSDAFFLLRTPQLFATILSVSSSPIYALEIFAAGLLTVGRAARHFLLFLALVAAEFLAAFAASIDTSHALLVVSLGLFPWAKNI